MGEIYNNCNKGGCQECIDAEIEFEDLLWRLSQIHKGGSFKSEILYKAGPLEYNPEHPDYEKVPEMLGAMFKIAYDNMLRWARLLVHEKPIPSFILIKDQKSDQKKENSDSRST